MGIGDIDGSSSIFRNDVMEKTVKNTSVFFIANRLHRFMEELGKKQENSRLYNDNQSEIHLANNSTFHSNTKHIHLRYHFIRLVFEDGQLKLENIYTSRKPADMLTKVVIKEKLSSCSVLVFLQG